MQILLIAILQSPGIAVDVSRPGPILQGNSSSYYAAISGDGSRIAFQSDSTNMLGNSSSNDINGVSDIFLFDVESRSISCLSVNSNGLPANNISYNPSLSDNGSVIAFNSQATDLIANDTTTGNDIFVHDLLLGQISRVSVDSNGVAGNGGSTWADLSGDGNLVVFRSEADNLVPLDQNGFADIFLHNRLTQTTTLISGVNSNGPSHRPSISSDGTHVVFESYATNLVPNDFNGVGDVFLVELATGIITRISEVSGIGGNASSSNSSVANGGIAVSFHSAASNFVSNDSGLETDVFYWQENGNNPMITRVSESLTMGEAQGASRFSEISADGLSVCFQSHADNLVVNDLNNSADVFIWDFASSTIELLSKSPMGQPANDYSLRPSISDNGQHVAFESAASNIVNPDRNDQIDVILYDRSPITNRAALSGSPTINPGNSGIYHLIGEVPFSNYYILGSSSLGGFVYNYQYLELGDGIRLLESGTLDQNAEAFYQTPVIPPRLSGASFYIEAYVEQSLDVIDSNVFAISVL